MEYAWGAYVSNASHLPAYDLTVRFHFPQPTADDPSATISAYTANKLTLPPDGVIHLRIPDVALRLVSEDPRVYGFYGVEMEFTDAAGTRWHRDIHGRLAEDSAEAQARPLIIRMASWARHRMHKHSSSTSNS